MNNILEHSMGKRKIHEQRSTAIVGTIHTRGGFRAASALGGRGLDLVEVRLDQFKTVPSKSTWASLPVPAIATARDPAEGGGNALPHAKRRALIDRALPHAALVDLELRNTGRFRPLISDLLAADKTLILSSHDFKSVPSLARMCDQLRRAQDAGAGIFKIAASPRRPMDILRLVELIEMADGFPVAAMGMGPLGRASRLFLSACGSRLLYGWLHRPQVPGQYPAAALRERLAEVLTQSGQAGADS